MTLICYIFLAVRMELERTLLIDEIHIYWLLQVRYICTTTELLTGFFLFVAKIRTECEAYYKRPNRFDGEENWYIALYTSGQH